MLDRVVKGGSCELDVDPLPPMIPDIFDLKLRSDRGHKDSAFYFHMPAHIGYALSVVTSTGGHNPTFAFLV